MKEKDKSIFYTTSYLRSIGTITGRLLTVAFCIITLIRQENYYPKIQGEIVDSFHSRVTWEYYIAINIKGKESYYKSTFENEFPILKEKALIGKNAVIWYERAVPNRFDRNASGLVIKKMIIDDEVIIPYNKAIGVNIFFICLGLFLIVINIIYMIQNPAHLEGRRE